MGSRDGEHSGVFRWFGQLETPQTLDSRLLEMPGIGYIVQGLASVLVFGLPEALFGRTLGKLITGTRVISLSHGGAPTIKQACIRTLVRLVPFEPFSFLWGDLSGWHDDWSKTSVVLVREPYEDI